MAARNTKEKALCEKASVVIRMLDRVQGGEEVEAVKRAITGSVEFYNECWHSWHKPGIENDYDAQTIIDGKNACRSAFDMAESISRRIAEELSK